MDFMPDFVKRRFPIRAKSVEEFVEAAKNEGCEIVEIIPCVDMADGARTATVGTIGDYKYGLDVETVTPRGRKIQFSENSFTRFGSDRGFSDSEERNGACIRILLIAEQRMKELQAKMPHATVHVTTPLGTMTADEIKQLHADAQKMDITI